MHLVYPPKFGITNVFDFPCDDCNYSGEIGNNGYMYNCFRQGKGGGGRDNIVSVARENFTVMKSFCDTCFATSSFIPLKGKVKIEPH